MNRPVSIFVVFLALCSQMALSAQTYEQVVRRNFWNESTNVSGIRLDSLSSSYAEVYGGYEEGGFRQSYQADHLWNAGVCTRSIRHLERISFKGGFSFNQTEGYGMCGSMFINPGYYPIDVLEFTPGRKTLQTYALDGGFSYDLTKHWRIGAFADFTSANIAKRKDLRHTNWKLDFEIAPSFTYHSGDFTVGAAYIFRKTGETVDAEQVGTAESSYYAFFDKGLMYGVHQVWTGSGVHLDEAGVNGLPVKEITNGAAVQMQYRGLFAELEYLHSKGSVGEKEYVWFRFPGQGISADLGWRKEGRNSEHYVRMGLDWKRENLHESVLEKISENGVTTVIGHGKNLIQAREVFSVVPEYEYVNDRWEVLAQVRADWRNSMTSQMYPYVYTQSLMTMEARLSTLVHLGPVDLSAELLYGAGRVNESSVDVDEESGVQTSPYRLQEWYDVQMEYQTARRIGTGMSARYDFWKGMYAKISGNWLHGFNLEFIESPDRYGVTAGVGYRF